MKRLLVWLLALTVIVSAPLLSADPAEANLANYRWKYGKVCVVDKTGPWPVSSATYRMDKVPDLKLVYRTRASDCPYSQRVYVYDGNYGAKANCAGTYMSWGGCAEASLYSSTGKWEWLGNAYRMYKCKIRLNNYYRYKWGWSDRRSLAMHEIGHCFGLDHTPHSSSLMNTKRWKYYNYPTSFDKSEVDRRYPW